MNSKIKKIALIIGASAVVWVFFKAMFFFTGMVNPALEYVLSYPISLFIGFLLASSKHYDNE